MNVYEKLQTMRCELEGMKLKKSGKNKFAGYEYFELQDFIPAINSLMSKHKLTSVISYDKEIAKLTLINSEKPEETLIFTSPMSEATLKGCHAVQNLGATITYLRRYLWINTLEIVESDALDADSHDNTNKTEKVAKTSQNKPSSPKEEPEPRVKTEEEMEAEEKLKKTDLVCSVCDVVINGAEKHYSLEKYGCKLCRDCQENASPLKKNK